MYIAAILRDTFGHGLSSRITTAVADPDWRGRVRSPLPADVCGWVATCPKLLVDSAPQPVLRLDADRLGHCAGMGSARRTTVRLQICAAAAVQSLVEDVSWD